MKRILHYFITLTATLWSLNTIAQKPETPSALLSEQTFSEMNLRNIGPAFMSGRISDIAIHPQNQNIWYVAVASGGVWKTNNSGTSWESVFDGQSVFATGCITIDPNNPHTLWLGTGENVGGRHLSFGDGVYRSDDDGKTWKNMGLKKSEHIAEIIVHPSNPQIVFVASQGPLWSAGGERGFYKSSDGGKTWKRTLGDDQFTGVTDIDIDPRNANVLYAATWQRHRTVAAYMGGGPETAIYRSEDGGETWKKIVQGLPTSNMGKIGIAVSPQKPDVIYAAIELDRRKGGVFKSTNRGESWTKQSDAVAGGTGPHYYQELYASPHAFDRIYLADVRMQVSDDGGKTFRAMNEEHKHSDNHSLAFRANDPNYLLVGTDGGIYESFDLAQNWRYINNLPLSQFYKIALDDAKPFYHIYGGTQDNSSQGGPSRTINEHGISNADWEVVLFADGHQPATEPENPNIIYAEWQQGNLVRIDRTTGEFVYIQPQAREGESYERFNWDAPILVSPHAPTRLYFASHRVWKSENRGDEWTPISGDLTQYQERMLMPIMGKKQSWENPWDIYAMSTYNTVTSLSESPKQEGLLYAGTDDGLIQVTEDGGKNWRKTAITALPGVPEKAFINDIKADLHDANTVYVCLDNHKYGDFKPYIFKSTNKGKTWTSLKANLPEPLLIWRLVQDHINLNLLFIGTEFGIYFSIDGGTKWTKLNTQATISFRDLAIHKRENDLVAASFGRGIFILDDYSPLRQITEKDLQKEAILFKPRKAWWYIERSPLGGDPKGSMGQSYFTAPNPPFGAVFTYYLKDDLMSKKEQRIKKEQEQLKNNPEVTFPGWNVLDEELIQEQPKVFIQILDKQNKLVRQIEAKTQKGMHRINWDLRFTSNAPIVLAPQQNNPQRGGFMVAPGTYKAVLTSFIDGKTKVLSDTLSFEVEQLHKGTLIGAETTEVAQFWKEFSDFQGIVGIFNLQLNDALNKSKAMQKALEKAPIQNALLTNELHNLALMLKQMEQKTSGSATKMEIGEKDVPTLYDRLGAVMMGIMNSTYGPTTMHRESFAIAKKEFQALNLKLISIIEQEIPQLEQKLKAAGAPYIQGQKN